MNKTIAIFILILLFIIGCGDSTTEKAEVSDPTKDKKITPAESVTPATEPPSKLVYLEQGWTRENEFRELSYYTSQGSRLIPYKWFLALEQPDKEGMFRDPKFIASLGFLNHRPQKEEVAKVYQDLNPDGLPVGFVMDPPGAEDGWMGFTCAACHTGQIDFEGITIRIDGGASMADLQTFLERMRDSLKSTLNDEAKFDRFARKVLEEKNPGSESATTLRDAMKKFSEEFSQLVARNDSPLRYGFARLDAFGAIVNKVAVTLTPENPENLGVSNAPVSYPFIWDAPNLDWVQWNGAANNPIGRNAGEVVGVYGEMMPTENPKIPLTSSARVKSLFELEQWLDALESPKWPEEILPKIDIEKVEKGEEIYKKSCQGCHSIPGSKGRMTKPEENFAGKTFIKTHMISIKNIGTDPKTATNFTTRTVILGPLGSALFPGSKPDDKMSAAIVLKKFVKLLIGPELLQLEPSQRAEYTGFRFPPKDSPFKKVESPSWVKHKFLAYKARPLNGIWATAPYLHNGSVPNLNQLLGPSARSKKFCVGSREFDPVNVGFEFKPDSEKGCGDYFEFDTTLEGNKNTGHDFSKDLDKDKRMALVEYLKTL